MKTILLLFTALLLAPLTYAQTRPPRVSPPDSVSGKIGDAEVTIHYSRPSVKGRKIWGDLVPYNKVWRAGANEATTFETSKAVMVNGQSLPAGKYGFFLVPAENMPWVAIFNNVPNQWGAFKYDVTKDQLRVNVQPKPVAAPQEQLIYTIEPRGFSLTWDSTTVFIPVKSAI